MGFPRQEYWSGLPFPSPGDLLDSGIKLMSPAFQADSVPFFTSEPSSPLFFIFFHSSVQFSSVAQSCLILCNPKYCSTPGLPGYHQLPESTQTHVRRVGDAIQTSHPLLSPSPPALNLSQHQGLVQWVSSSYQVAKVLEFQLQHQSFQWIFRAGFL